MTVHTTYFGGVSQFEPADDAEVIGVVRYPKDFVERVTDRNVPALAPPANLLDAYKTVEASAEADGAAFPSDVAWQTVRFEPRYLNYLRSFPGPQAVIEELRERASERDIWLVCWEKDCRWCHRRLLTKEIVAELADVEIVHHPDPTTLDVGRNESDEESSPNAALADFSTPEA
ncbi:DUF488 family protein [Halovivax limisalsi]|uniref:DUF488 family protein, N3 subclade n=1 Tax=Halovivax limisalsi TaxID=1453760 RepID=UPI001FFC53BF|nr:DUF488 family protein [Halovivax limisalsi]